MQIQPITNQPSHKGKINFEKGTTTKLTKHAPNPLLIKFKEISKLVSDKPYDIFISQNKQNPSFYDIAANTSFENAQKIKEYTVKVQADIITDSIIAAAKDAMDMFEKYITKGAKR